MFARRADALASRDGPVSMVVTAPGRCRGLLDPLDVRARRVEHYGAADAALGGYHRAPATAAVGAAKDVARKRVAHMRFEDGPCTGAVDPDPSLADLER